MSIPAKNPEKSTESRLEELEKLKNEVVERADVALDVLKKPKKLFTGVQEKMGQGKEALEKKISQFNAIPNLVKAGLLILGGTIGYKAYNWWNSTESETEKKQEKSWFNGTTLLIGLGALAGTSVLVTLLKNSLGIQVAKEKMEEAIESFKDGKFKEGLEALRSHPESELWVNTARDLGVRSSQIAQFKDVSWKQWMDHRKGKEADKSYFRMALEKIGLVNPELNDDDIKEEIGNKSEEDRLSAYIEQYKDKVELKEEDTLEEVLGKIQAYKESLNEEEVTMIESVEQLGEEFKHTGEALSTIDKVKDAPELAANILVGAVKDGAGILVNNAGTFVVKYGIMAPITNLAILGETIIDVAQMGMGQETPEGVVANYFRATSCYIGTGAIAGAALARWEGKSMVWGATKGVGWGLLTPIKVFDLTLRGTRAMGLAGEYAETYARSMQSWSQLKFGNPEEAVQAIRGKTLYHAEIIKQLCKKDEAIARSKKAQFLEALNPFPKATRSRIEFHLREYLSSRDEYLRQIGETTDSTLKVSDFQDGNLTFDTLEKDLDSFTERHGKAEIPNMPVRPKVNAAALEAKRVELETSGTSGEKIKHLDSLREQMETEFKNHLDEISQLRAQNVSPEAIQAKEAEMRAIGEKGRATLESEIKNLSDHVSTMTEVEKNEFARVLSQMSKGRVVRSFLAENLKLRAKAGAGVGLVLGVANGVWSYSELPSDLAEAQVREEMLKIGQQIGWDTLEVTISVMAPFGCTDWMTFATGKNIYMEDVGTFQRVISGIAGIYSVASDSLASLAALGTAEFAGAGGAAVYAATNSLEAGLRAGGKAPEIIAAARKLMPRLAELAQNVGGWPKLIKILRGGEKWGGRALATSMAGALGYAGLQIAYNTTTAQVLEVPQEIAERMTVEEEPEAQLAA